MKVCVCMCVCVSGVRRPIAGPTQPITPIFGMGSSFHPGSAPSQRATQNSDPNPKPAGSLDQSAQDFFTMKL